MFAQEDLKWIAATSTELNATLQQISRYADLARAQRNDEKYLEMLCERVEVATKTTQALFDRITSSILESKVTRPSATVRPGYPSFSVVPPPVGQSHLPPPTYAPPAMSKGTPDATPLAALPNFAVRNSKGPRELLLLVDDDLEIADIAATMLTDEGYKVILAKDGVEALNVYQKIGKNIGLVILDFFLPVLDGDAVFEELKALNRDVAVVLSSGFAEQSKVGLMLASGLRGFLPKPYTREKLLEQVRSILDVPRAAMA